MTRPIYLFIDGAYLRTIYSQIGRKWFGTETKIDFYQLIAHYQNPEKIFYYDCLPVKKVSETETQFKSRFEPMKEFIETIQQLPGVHVQLGELVVGKKKKKKSRQKGVDVQLAVDMMEHAKQKNMGEVILLAGDRDFEPLVKSIIRMGVQIRIAANPMSISRSFAYSADTFQPILLTNIWVWTEEKSKAIRPIASVWNDNILYSKVQPGNILARGVVHARLPKQEFEIFLISDNSTGKFIIEIPSYDRRNGYFHVAYTNREGAELCVEMDIGKIEWEK